MKYATYNLFLLVPRQRELAEKLKREVKGAISGSK